MTPVDEPTSSDLEAPEFFESIRQHIAIGTSDSKFHSELPRSSCLEVSSVLPQQVVLEHMLPLPTPASGLTAYGSGCMAYCLWLKA